MYVARRENTPTDTVAIMYVGPTGGGVEIAATGQICRKGETVDVRADIANSLLEQATWEQVLDKEADNEAEADADAQEEPVADE